MYNEEQIKEYVHNLGLDPNEYCVIAGATLVMHGIRENTDDIDLYVSEKAFKQLQEKYEVVKSPKKEYQNLYLVNGELEVTLTDMKGRNTYNICDMPCNGILADYKWKKERNREKDQAIIRKLDNLMYVISQHYRCPQEELTEEQIEEYIINQKIRAQRTKQEEFDR